MALALGTGLLAQPAAAAELTWRGQFGSPSWSASILGLSNWAGGAVPQDGDALVFAGNTGLVNNNDYVGLSVSGLSFAAGAGAFTLNGRVPSAETRITLTGNLTNHSNTLQTVNMGIDARGSALRWDGGNQGMVINGNLSLANASTLTLANQTRLNVDSWFAVGTSGYSELNITSGSLLYSQRNAIGAGSGSMGKVTVAGAGSSWFAADILEVGVSGRGALMILDGGSVTSGYSRLGALQQGSGDALVQGENSKWIILSSLFIGEQGSGRLTISDGGFVKNKNAHIGLESGGLVVVTGTNSRWVTEGGLNVGGGGSGGSLLIDRGGFVSSDSGFVGSRATGNVTVTGVNSRWAVGRLLVGNGHTGNLAIRDGGNVTSTLGEIDSGGGFSGNVTVEGAGSSWLNTGELNIGRAGLGRGFLSIYNRGMAATGALVVGDKGVLNLDGGTLQVHSAALEGAGQFNWASGTLRFTTEGATLGAGALQLDSITTLPANKALEFSHSFAVGSGNQLLLAGGTLGGTGTLLNDGYLAGFGHLAGSGGFSNSGLLVQSGGNLVLSNTGPNINTGNWELLPAFQLQLAGATLANQGTVSLNGATLSGSGTLANAAGGTVFGRGNISANFSNAGALVLESGTTGISNAFTSSGQIQLTSNAAALAGGLVSNSGQIEGRGRVNNAVNNTGTLEAIGGTLTFAGALANTGRGVIAAGAGGKVLVLAGLASNDAHIQLGGGTFDNNGAPMLNATTGTISGFGTLRSGALVNNGKLLLATGASAVHADLRANAGSQMILSGQGNTAFYGAVDVRGGAELRVSQGAVATFFGLVNQRSGAQFTGTGHKYYEGGLAVGNSPGLGSDAGSVTFGASNTYTAELGGTDAGDAQGNGIQFDRYVVAGTLSFGGTLAVVAWDGFAPQAGQRFDLFDWSSSQGTFDVLNFAQAPLAGGLTWDTSRLYIDGSLAVAAVPEPASTSLLLAGLGVVGWLARRRPRVCAVGSAG